MSRFLKKPVRPLEVDADSNVKDILDAMGDTAFQARTLSMAARVWGEMLRDRTTIFLGLSGAMVPAGMRRVIRFLIENRLIDCLVSTGANLFHDAHETLGKFHWQGCANAKDLELKRERIDRIYDVLASDREFCDTDKFIARFASTLDKTMAYTTREFLFLLGERLSKVSKEDGILTSAYKARIPIYCPAIGDSSIGIALVVDHPKAKLLFDTLKDVEEMARLVIGAKATGVIYLGGGTPKNFIQQTEVTAPFMGKRVPGHKYAIQVTCDSPQWGGLSGCTFEEAQSWGKIARNAHKVTVYCDTTIALPLIVTALAQDDSHIIRKRKLPKIPFFNRKAENS